MQTTPAIFDRYQQVKERIPQTNTEAMVRDIDSLSDIADEISAFVFDAFGVLNVGNTLIEGADERIQELRALGAHIRILTNAASYDHAGAVAKFKALGLVVKDEEIITSRQAAIAHLDKRNWGVIAAPEDSFKDISVPTTRLSNNVEAYDAVDGFVFLSSTGWTEEKQNSLMGTLLRQPRPVVIANPDLVAPRDNGFSIEPGHYGHLLVDQGIDTVRFFGKPFSEVYQLVEDSLPDVRPERIAMCGDTLHTDIVGAAARHWRTVLVTQDGLFAGYETRDFCEKACVYPDWRLPRI